MTREEAIDRLKEGEPFSEIYNPVWDEALNMAIKALEQEPILDKIRAEIDIARYIDKNTKLCKNANASGLEVAMRIIDKYKAESEE